MSVSAQAGMFSFGPQAAKGSTPPKWYRHRATTIDLGTNDETREGPPEVGGIAVPTFPYKSGPLVGGGFTIQPRYESSFGFLLMAMMGKCVSTADPYNLDVFNHVFSLPTDSTYVPWLGFRKHIPRKDGVSTTDLGEIFKDCKVIGGTLSLPNDAPLGMRIDTLGRKFEFDAAPDAWTYENTLESWESIPVACQTGGFIKIGGVELPVVAAQIGWQNVPLDPRMERVFGDPFIEDVTIIQRRLSYEMTVKWENPDLYRAVYAGSTSGTEWSGTPHTASFSVKSVSSSNMPSETEPYALTIDADEVMMSQQGGITLAGNGAVMLRFSGVALEATNYASFTLRNKVDDTPGYAWPV